MTVADIIAEKVRLLPEAEQRQVLDEIERRSAAASNRPPLREWKNCLAGLGPAPTLEEFQQVRREMWGESTET